MKELTIQEKARRYDQAIKLVNSKWYYRNQPCFINVSELFPEFKENKNENIRKWLIEYFQEYKSTGIEGFANGLKIDDIIAWLERQDEQKSDDKIELKFKIGDWVVFNNNHLSIYQVEKIENGYYILRHPRGGAFRVCVLHDEDLRLWTLQDAKDGDVLCGYSKTDYPWIGIFHNLNNENTFNSYCFLQAGQHGKFCPSSEENIFGKRNINNHVSVDTVPATKEQRDLLFAKMREAGYKWNENKKELIKL